MTAHPRITPEQHREQVEKYIEARPGYATYAAALQRVLQRGCALAFPEALVQSRAKAVSSFAEKCARKFAKYPNAVEQMTDLCGGRVIVQTLEQVRAVRQFIEANFKIVEQEDKGLSLSEDEFGYRDMHYIIELCPERCAALGITAAEQAAIGAKRAEIQVRTWLQHAWADTLHDRMYKTTLQLPLEARRTGALLAALMEEGDRSFNQMADDLDGMIANYTAFASQEEVRKEIAIQSLILQNEREADKKPGLALKLARLLAACGEYAHAIDVLEPHQDNHDASRGELLQTLGHALCKLHRAAPESAAYQRGIELLEQSLATYRQPASTAVLHLRRQASLHARVLWRLGWALEPRRGAEHRARECLREAHEHEPGNPYYLADMLGLEIRFSAHADLPSSMRTLLRQAVRTCLAHASAGIELPGAYFAAGRLNLLLDCPLEAIGYYARGIRHVLDAQHCIAADVLENEALWLGWLHAGQSPTPAQRWIHELLTLAGRLQNGLRGPAEARRALIVAGGAATISESTLAEVWPLLEAALEAFSGQVIAGGTRVGVPGCVAEVATALAARGAKRFELVGYITARLPHDAPQDDRYDRLVVCGEGKFSPEQLLRCWSDLLDTGISPRDVVLLGCGGGPLTAVEYRLALALGATVAVVASTGGAVQALLADPLWSELPNLLPLPPDAASVRAVVTPAGDELTPAVLEQLAQTFHENYLALSTNRLPDNLKPWPKLPETFRQASIEQARHTVRILEARGFGVRGAASPRILQDFTAAEIEDMAELEHGRWNVDRLRGGWRCGARDDRRKLHDSLVAWSELPEEIKRYDREAIRKFPEILAQAGFEIYRK